MAAPRARVGSGRSQTSARHAPPGRPSGFSGSLNNAGHRPARIWDGRSRPAPEGRRAADAGGPYDALVCVHAASVNRAGRDSRRSGHPAPSRRSRLRRDHRRQSRRVRLPYRASATSVGCSPATRRWSTASGGARADARSPATARSSSASGHSGPVLGPQAVERTSVTPGPASGGRRGASRCVGGTPCGRGAGSGGARSRSPARD
jgi:hypothetical protein